MSDCVFFKSLAIIVLEEDVMQSYQLFVRHPTAPVNRPFYLFVIDQGRKEFMFISLE